MMVNSAYVVKLTPSVYPSILMYVADILEIMLRGYTESLASSPILVLLKIILFAPNSFIGKAWD